MWISTTIETVDVGNGWINTKGPKCLIFILVPWLRIANGSWFVKETTWKNRGDTTKNSDDNDHNNNNNNSNNSSFNRTYKWSL